jgi:hypothetical protein
LLRLLLEDRFPRIWVPSPENRDLRQLLWHRHRLVQMRTRIMKSAASHSYERRPALEEEVVQRIGTSAAGEIPVGDLIADFFREFLKFLLFYVVRPVLLLVGALFSSLYNVLFAWWIGNRDRKPNADGFPSGFRVQRIGITRAVDVSGLPGAEIAEYFRDHPETAKALLGTTSVTLPRLSFQKTETARLESDGSRETRNMSVSETLRISLTQRPITSCSHSGKVDGLPQSKANRF